MSHLETISIADQKPTCPDSWWAQNLPRSEWYRVWQQRVPQMKVTKQTAAYPNTSGQDE